MEATLILGQKLTSTQVKAHFPGALEALKIDYQYSVDHHFDDFVEQFHVNTADALVDTVLEFYVVENDAPYSEVDGAFTVSFTEPNLGTNVSSTWIGDSWET